MKGLVRSLTLAYVVFADSATFSDPDEDPQTLGEWMPFWSRVPGELAIGLLPFFAGSIAFALAFVSGARGKRAA